MEKLPDGHVSIVTGAARGIGRAIALELAREGSNIVIADINKEGSYETAEQVDKMGVGALVVPADVTSGKGRNRLFYSALKNFSRIDCLVNNAALVDFGKDIVLDFTEEEIRKIWETNYHAPRMLAGIVAEYMKEAQIPGSLVFITSIHDKEVRMQDPYHASKAALEATMREMAVQYGVKNRIRIRSNAVAPGAIHEKPDATLEELEEGHFAMETALGRRGLPREVGRAVVFLASNDNSGYITGATIPVDGYLGGFNWVTKQYYEGR